MYLHKCIQCKKKKKKWLGEKKNVFIDYPVSNIHTLYYHYPKCLNNKSTQYMLVGTVLNKLMLSLYDSTSLVTNLTLLKMNM